MQRRQFIKSIVACGLLPTMAWSDESLLNNPNVLAFIQSMQDKNGLNAEQIKYLFSHIKKNKTVLKYTGTPTNPAKKTYWNEYRKKRLTAKYIAKGSTFYEQNKTYLEKAEATFGVDKFIITAIIGVETRYGEYTGTFPVIESLATLAFYHPSRGEEFKKQLEYFLIYTDNQKISPLTIHGSYAGAFGIPQFLPESVIKHSVDFDNSGYTNLFTVPDAIGSVGRFLLNHGWIPNTTVSHPVRVSKSLAQILIKENADGAYKPIYQLNELRDRGVLIDESVNNEAVPYVFIDLENKLGNEYRIGTPNFYALTRYNRSFKYAASVTDLSIAIKNIT